MRFCFSLVSGWACMAMAAHAAGLPGGIKTVVRADPRTGRLVRSVVHSPARTSTRSPALRDAVHRIAAEHSLPTALIDSVIQVESNYNPFAISSKGASGLMQLVPSTARRFGVADVFDPVENIQGGARYLRYLLDLYDGNYTLALAAYNAGEGAVARYGDVPPFPETRNYVTLVGKQLAGQGISPDGKAPPAPQAPAGKPVVVPQEGPPGPAHIESIVEPDGTVRYVSR